MLERKTIVFIIVALVLLISEGSFAHNHPGYSHDGKIKTSHPAWMETLRDNVRISELSIPGTHDTMAFYGGDIAQTQTMSLENQLHSGVRALDVRCRHIENVFAIHHGIIYEKVFFDDVMNILVNFLAEHPSETVLMRVKEEYTPANNTRSFPETLDYYWARYQDYLWTPTSDNPELAEIRGKIVILQNFPSGKKYGINYNSFQIQDAYNLSNNWDLYGKWAKIKEHLKNADEGDGSTKYMHYLSGSVGSFPYFVASGHSSPGTSAPRLATGRTTPKWKDIWPDFPRVSCFIGLCTIAFEGTNVLAYERLGSEYKNRVGIIMSDFPGPGLIDRIIKLNDRLK